VQFLTGLSNVVLQWPLALAVLHNGGAAVLVALLVAINFRLSQGGMRTAAVPSAKSADKSTGWAHSGHG
jgi:cytochrome c oxidase assembly protein subunit 15